MKVRAVVLDESGIHNIRPEDARFISEIRSAYAYDPEVRVHACELIPSYELHYLYTYIVWNGEVEEEKRDELYDRFRRGDERDEVCYMHCADVEALPYQQDCGEYEDMASAIEDLQANHRI